MKQCRRKVVSGRSVAGAIRSLVNARVCSLSVLGSFMRVCSWLLMYGSETIWKEKERSRIKDVQINNFRGLLGIRRKLCGVKKRVVERIDGSVLQ